MKLYALVLSAGVAGLFPSWFVMAAGAGRPAGPSSIAYSDAEVKKVDAAQGKVVLKHGPIDNLGMPAMTMVFRADPETLARLKVGDSVKFRADKVDGAMKVTELAPR